MFDTCKGGDYLCDQDAVEIMAREAIETVYDLEHGTPSIAPRTESSTSVLSAATPGIWQGAR